MILCPLSSFGELHLETSKTKGTAQRFNALRALPIYLVFEDEKSNGQTNNTIRQKVGIKKIA